MKSINDLNKSYKHSIVSDEIIEFHAGRILILIGTCGVKNKITGEISLEGLTKFAKLDFFIRYPHHFRTASLYPSEQPHPPNQEAKHANQIALCL
jgi:hypothetical protein